MAQRITIQFPADRERDFYFRVFCWADDTLGPAIEGAGLGTIHDVERIRETVNVEVHKKQDLGAVLAVITKTLPKHFPDGEGLIIRG